MRFRSSCASLAPTSLAPTRGATTFLFYRCQVNLSLRRYILLCLLPLLLLLAACGGSNTPQTKRPTPTPTPGQGQQLLMSMAQKLDTAKTLHGEFDVAITGQTLSGNVNTEIWSVPPNKNRTVVLQSSFSQFPAGSVTVTNGKQIWQYDPVKKVVYTGAVTNTGTPTPGSIAGTGSGQTQFILNLVQSIFACSDATIVSSSANINGHSAYDVHVVPQGQAAGCAAQSGTVTFNYVGEVYIDKTTGLPLRVDLTLQGFGQVTLNLPKLILNQPIPDSTFTFVPPAGVKVLPLQQASATPGTGSISLAQAQQQAGYHLLSIPASETNYELEGVTALGSPGSQIFTLNYIKDNTSFTITEGKSLANLPNTGGQQISLRGTMATLSTSNGDTALYWTEKGVGIQIEGKLSNDQIVAIANLLS